jgi:hypothetical protein
MSDIGHKEPSALTTHENRWEIDEKPKAQNINKQKRGKAEKMKKVETKDKLNRTSSKH